MPHIPGPWEVQRWVPTSTLYTATVGAVAQALTVADVYSLDPQEAMANARVIAQAPTLLALLQEIVGQPTPNSWGYDAAAVALNDDWRARARAALAAATAKD